MKKIPCEIWTRCVGYFRPTSQYNKGKLEEFNDRKYIKVGGVNDNRRWENKDGRPNKK